LVKDFESKSIKRGGKIPVQQFTITITQSSKQISYQITNNYATTPTSPNPYITRKLNNMDEAKLLKEEHNDRSKLYYKMLKGLEAMINVQKQIWDIMKIAEEANTTVTEMEGTILKVSINNQVTNTINILGILEDLCYDGYLKDAT